MGAFAVTLVHERIRKEGVAISFSVWRCAVMCLVGLGALIFYFAGFKTVATREVFSILKSIEFFVSYMGAAVPLWNASLVIGVAVIVVCFWLLLRVSRIRNTPALAFLAYLTACVLAAALMRGHYPTSSLLGRYRIVPVCLVATLAVLVHEQLRLKESVVRLVSCLGLFLVVVYVSAFTYVARPALMERNEELRLGMLSFVDTGDTDGLWYQSTQIDGPAALRQMIERRMYNPQKLKHNDEHPPYKYDKEMVFKEG